MLLLGLTTLGSAQQLPAGWTKRPANLTGQQFREKDSNHFLVVKGDFDGDGVQDRALLLVDQHNHKMGFFVCLTTATDLSATAICINRHAFTDRAVSRSLE